MSHREFKKSHKEKILKAIAEYKQEPKPYFWQHLFRHVDKFVFFIAHGEHEIIVDPEKKIRNFELIELENFDGIPICSGGGNNIFDIKLTGKGDKLIICANVRTDFAVIKVIVK